MPKPENDTCTRCKKERATRYISRSCFCEACYKKWVSERCTKQLFHRWGNRTCENKATKTVGGKRYCTAHTKIAKEQEERSRIRQARLLQEDNNEAGKV
jgi:hypothetical protein